MTRINDPLSQAYSPIVTDFFTWFWSDGRTDNMYQQDDYHDRGSAERIKSQVFNLKLNRDAGETVGLAEWIILRKCRESDHI